MVRSFLFLTFLAATAVAGEDGAVARIAAIEARIRGRIGVAALDTTNSKHVDYHADERFPMCSTFKFLAAAAVLKRVDEKKEKLERFVPTFRKTGLLATRPGAGQTARNDIAIMRPPGRAPMVLAIYSVGSTATPNDRTAAVSEVARIVAESI